MSGIKDSEKINMVLLDAIIQARMRAHHTYKVVSKQTEGGKTNYENINFHARARAQRVEFESFLVILKRLKAAERLDEAQKKVLRGIRITKEEAIIALESDDEHALEAIKVAKNLILELDYLYLEHFGRNRIRDDQEPLSFEDLIRVRGIIERVYYILDALMRLEGKDKAILKGIEVQVQK